MLSSVDVLLGLPFLPGLEPRARFSVFREHPPTRSRSSNRTVIFNNDGGFTMARGDKSKYSSKQKRMAEHIEQGYKKRGASTRKPSGSPGRPSTRNLAAGQKEDRVSKKRSHSSERAGRTQGREKIESEIENSELMNYWERLYQQDDGVGPIAPGSRRRSGSSSR